MAYAADLKSVVERREGSSPSGATTLAGDGWMPGAAGNVASSWETSDSGPMAPRRTNLRGDGCRSPYLAAVVVLGSGCAVFAPPTRVTVLQTTSSDRALREEGTALNIDHWELSGAPPGIERGFFVVKSELEWHNHWQDTPTEKVPVLPADLDFSKEMLFIAAPPDHDVLSTEVRSVVSNEGGIHAYVVETQPGVDCPPPDKDAKPNYDLARVPLVDGKDVQFHVDATPGEPCGLGPQAKITCRQELAGAKDHGSFVEKLAVDPGTKVSCIVGAFTSPRPVIDLTWTFAGLPLGATSRMIVGSRGTAVTFTPDVFGTYALQVEVLDDLQRRGTSQSEVEVRPKEPLVLQMIWTKFDPDDDPSTFPRLELHAESLNADGGPVGSPLRPKPPKPVAKPGMPDTPPPPSPLPGTAGAPPIVWGRVGGCSIEGTAPYCKATAVGFTTVMTLDPGAASLYAVGLHFTDDRVQGQAVPCVRSYRDGKLVQDLCDTNARKADSWWQVGVFDGATGKTVQTLAAERAQAAIKAAAEAKAAADAKALADAKVAAEVKAAAAARTAAEAKALAEARASAARATPAPSGSAVGTATPAVVPAAPATAADRPPPPAPVPPPPLKK